MTVVDEHAMVIMVTRLTDVPDDQVNSDNDHGYNNLLSLPPLSSSSTVCLFPLSSFHQHRRLYNVLHTNKKEKRSLITITNGFCNRKCFGREKKNKNLWNILMTQTRMWFAESKWLRIANVNLSRIMGFYHPWVLRTEDFFFSNRVKSSALSPCLQHHLIYSFIIKLHLQARKRWCLWTFRGNLSSIRLRLQKK